MAEIDVVAVVGACAPERLRYAKRAAVVTERVFLPATRLASSPDPLEEAIALVPWAAGPAGVVLELPSHVPVREAIGAFAEEGSPAALVAVVCVLDAAHLLEDLLSEDYVARGTGTGTGTGAGAGSRSRELIARSVLTATQLEYASTVVVVGWRSLGREELSTVLALVAHLSPGARVRLSRDAVEPVDIGPAYRAGQERAGWIGVLNGDFDPTFTDPRVSALHYENLRPFHPGRLRSALERIESGAAGTVVRSAGLCRFATRPGVTAQWEHAGRMISFEPVARDDRLGADEEVLAFGQDLALLGLDLDADALTAVLDEAVLTDAELAHGPMTWALFPDPFPAWEAESDQEAANGWAE